MTPDYVELITVRTVRRGDVARVETYVDRDGRVWRLEA